MLRGGGAVAFGEEQAEVLLFLRTTGFEQQVHVVPSGRDFVKGVVAVEGVDYCSGLVAFKGILGIVDIAIEDFRAALGVTADHVVVWVTGTD